VLLFTGVITPLYIIPGTDVAVVGVTSLGDELFALRLNSAKITAYNVSTFNVSGQLALRQTSTVVWKRAASTTVSTCLIPVCTEFTEFI